MSDDKKFGNVVIGIALIVFALPIVHYFVAGVGNSEYKKPSGWKEDIFCMNAVCIQDKDGIENCIEIKAQLSKVTLIPENSLGSENRMNVKMLGKSCETDN